MKRKPLKLTLTRETLRHLHGRELGGAVGGNCTCTCCTCCNCCTNEMSCGGTCEGCCQSETYEILSGCASNC